jgi:ligand-binding sensor domain-containing protein
MRFLTGFVLLLLSFEALSQKGAYNFAKLDINNGLSHNQVNAIIKDSKGFMWFGTLSGLNRYDGYACRVFRQNVSDTASLLDNNILSIYELPLEKMWVTTQGGPCIYDPVTEKFDAKYANYLQSLGLPSGSITKIVKGNNGRYWCKSSS